jgi:hypothetical protein
VPPHTHLLLLRGGAGGLLPREGRLLDRLYGENSSKVTVDSDCMNLGRDLSEWLGLLNYTSVKLINS